MPQSDSPAPKHKLSRSLKVWVRLPAGRDIAWTLLAATGSLFETNPHQFGQYYHYLSKVKTDLTLISMISIWFVVGWFFKSHPPGSRLKANQLFYHDHNWYQRQKLNCLQLTATQSSLSTIQTSRFFVNCKLPKIFFQLRLPAGICLPRRILPWCWRMSWKVKTLWKNIYFGG